VTLRLDLSSTQAVNRLGLLALIPLTSASYTIPFATMILPWRRHILLFVFCAANTLADSGPFGCTVDISGVHYDLTILGHDERTVPRDRAMPPSIMHDALRFNICGDLKPQDGIKEADQVCDIGTQSSRWLTGFLQCGQGTRACLTTTSKKKEEEVCLYFL
jgi:hypothetical protein